MTRVHEATGVVVRGDQRGRQLGFPTANLEVEPVQLPKDGVYAVVARVLDEAGALPLQGVANLGNRPTFQAGHAVEVHLFGFDGDPDIAALPRVPDLAVVCAPAAEVPGIIELKSLLYNIKIGG